MSGDTPEIKFGVEVDKETNEFEVWISKGPMIVLDESEARWLKKALSDYLPVEIRQNKPSSRPPFPGIFTLQGDD